MGIGTIKKILHWPQFGLETVKVFVSVMLLKPKVSPLLKAYLPFNTELEPKNLMLINIHLIRIM